MSLAPVSALHRIVGSFQHSNGSNFEYEPNSDFDSWLPLASYPHRIWVRQSPINDSGWRYANVKKTVAYIVVDEDDHGQPVIEKWSIKNHRNFH